MPVTRIADNAFTYYSGLETVIIPSTVTEIGKGAFRSCHSLSRIDIPSSVTKIGESAFYYCKKLKSFTLPSKVDTIEKYTFSDCIGLTSFIIHDNIISIGTLAFYGCNGLTSIDIPQSVQNIEFFAFHCENLKNIYVHWSEPITDKTIFDSQIYDSATLYVPKGCANLYRNSAKWSEFRNIKEGNYTGIDCIMDDDRIGQIDFTKPYSVYNLQGTHINLLIDNLPTGIYIIRQGCLTKKIHL